MLWRFVLVWLAGLVAAALPSGAMADPTFVFLRSFQDPGNFEGRFHGCIDQFKAAGGLAGSIVRQLDGAEVVIYYQKGSAGVPNPSPGGDSTGEMLHLHWDSALSGRYDDNAPKVPCAALLHELQHASRFFTGKECTGPYGENSDAYAHDESMGVRAENWWLDRLDRKQRSRYGKGGDPLPRWTRWPASSAHPMPRAPRCTACADPTAQSVSAGASAKTCRRCTGFHQPGCFDLKGGIYSGGDHRRVALGSLRIIVGDLAYCQGREPCEFKNCVTCPHLDTAFPQGAKVTAIATPGEASRFARWGPGVCQGKGPTCTFTANRDSCISAQFLLTSPTAPPQSLPTIACPEDP